MRTGVRTMQGRGRGAPRRRQTRRRLLAVSSYADTRAHRLRTLRGTRRTLAIAPRLPRRVAAIGGWTRRLRRTRGGTVAGGGAPVRGARRAGPRRHRRAATAG